MSTLSWEFGFFLLVCAALARLLPARWRAGWLLLASLVYAGRAGGATLGALLFSTALAYLAARALAGRAGRARRLILVLSVGALAAVLAVFKYAGFAADVLGSFGAGFSPPALALPLGVSFFTFLLIGYLLDVHHRRIPAETDPARFALFASFFPKLPAGPIERGRHLLPQLANPGPADPARMTAGLRLILWGAFKKLVIADRLALYVDAVYNQPQAVHPVQVVLATYFFAFQIYCDFSAYSDIAIGAARLLGLELAQNFRRPYLAASIQEFWSRWHISLTTWFRDYLYLPAVRARMAGGGDRQRLKLTDYTIVLVFLLSGLWHGAGWTFILWGGLHGLYLLAANWRAAWAARGGRVAPPLQGWRRTLAALGTFHLVLPTWVFFRAGSIGAAAGLFGALADWRGLPDMQAVLGPLGAAGFALALAGVAFLFAVETWIERRGAADFDDALAGLGAPSRWAAYYGLAALILFFGVFAESTFIYFRF
jgi:D-alanyl-lipoteichoic acid acyltransferase DltB (MBOAT superfamily)